MYWRRMYAKGKPHPPYNKVFKGAASRWASSSS